MKDVQYFLPLVFEKVPDEKTPTKKPPERKKHSPPSTANEDGPVSIFCLGCRARAVCLGEITAGRGYLCRWYDDPDLGDIRDSFPLHFKQADHPICILLMSTTGCAL